MKALCCSDVVIQMLFFACPMTVVCCFKSNQITRSSSQGHTCNWLKEKKHRHRIFTVLTEYESIIASLCVCLCVWGQLYHSLFLRALQWSTTESWSRSITLIKSKEGTWADSLSLYCISPLTRKQTEKEKERERRSITNHLITLGSNGKDAMQPLPQELCVPCRNHIKAWSFCICFKILE